MEDLPFLRFILLLPVLVLFVVFLELRWLQSVLGLSLLVAWLLVTFFGGLLLCLKPGKLLPWTLLWQSWQGSDRAKGSDLAGEPGNGPGLEGAYFETVISSVVAGILLMIPDILSDVAAVLLLLPPIRRRIFHWLIPTAHLEKGYVRFSFEEKTSTKEKSEGESSSRSSSPRSSSPTASSTTEDAFPSERIQDAEFEILSKDST